MSGSIRIALLRGINVGRAKRIAMADLRALVVGLGYTRVSTLLNSGNIVFTVGPKSKGDPAVRIQKAIQEELGVTCRVTVLTAAELDHIMTEHPLAAVADDPSRLLVSVPATPADRAKLAQLGKQKWAPDAFALGVRVAYLWCSRGLLESPLGKAVLGREFGDAVTSRNWATITKLHALTK